MVAEQVLEKFMKSTELVMQDAVLLKQELHQVRTSNKHQKEKKMMTRAFIQDGGSLTGKEGLQRLREREARGAIAKITGGQHGAVTAIKKAMID